MTCILLSVRILGRYETRKGVQSPPKATGFPSKDTSMRETASATDDMSSTLKIQETYLHAYTLYYSVNIHNIKKRSLSIYLCKSLLPRYNFCNLGVF